MRHFIGPRYLDALAFLIASSVLFVTGVASAKPPLVPWVSKPVTSALLKSLSPKPLPIPTPKTNAPPCAEAKLALSVGVLQWSQNGGVALNFRNASSTTCLERGTPQVVATKSDERNVVAAAAPMPTFAEVANIAPGAADVVDLSAPLVCAANPGGSNQNLQIYHRIVITMPNGATRTLHGLTLNFPCGMSVTPFATPKPAVKYAVLPMTHLVPHIHLASSVSNGGTLVYSIELSNPLGRPVALTLCPAYIEHSSQGTKLEFQLNCMTVREIPAHQSVWYQMKMRDIAPGPVTVFWSLIAGPAPEARATVRVN
ncbi:MAG TPA: hypothetical protein VMU68_14085 [Acidimicrobiales bacterium]|nr:hypothetical protein [Acidimicrobiales bacterium]